MSIGVFWIVTTRSTTGNRAPTINWWLRRPFPPASFVLRKGGFRAVCQYLHNHHFTSRHRYFLAKQNDDVGEFQAQKLSLDSIERIRLIQTCDISLNFVKKPWHSFDILWENRDISLTFPLHIPSKGFGKRRNKKMVNLVLIGNWKLCRCAEDLLRRQDVDRQGLAWWLRLQSRSHYSP